MRLRYWIKTGLRNGVTLLGGCVMFSLMMLLQRGADGLADILRIGVGFLIAFGGGMSMVLNMLAYKLYLPVALSFGSSRREAFVGLQFLRLLPGAIIMAAAALAMVPAEMDVRAVVPAGLGAILLLDAVGSGVGMVSVKFGKGFIVVCSAVIGMLAGLCGVGGGFVFLLSPELISGSLPWVILAVGAAAYAVSMIPEYRIVYQLNVKL